MAPISFRIKWPIDSKNRSQSENSIRDKTLIDLHVY